MLQTHASQPVDNRQFEDVLIDFSKSILEKDKVDDILWDLAKNCIAKLGFVDCVIYLIDDVQRQLVQKAAYGPKSPKDNSVYNPVNIAIGEGITGYVAQTKEAVIVDDTSKDPRYIVDDKNRLSEIAVPIITNNMVYGVIDCEHPEKGFFTEQHLRMLTAVAAICAMRIKNIRDTEALIEKQKRLLQIKEEMITLKLKAFYSQMNPHFVFNALNAIQSYITSGEKKLALEYLSAFSKLIRFYLSHLELERVAIDQEMTMLNSYLKLQKLRYNEQFNYNITLEKTATQVSAEIPSFVIQTVLENIIEQATYNQHTNQMIDVNIKVEKAFVHVVITYSHNPVTVNRHQYTPEYRERIVQWQDQIRILNQVKHYGIGKSVQFLKQNAQISGSCIILKLPNLYKS